MTAESMRIVITGSSSGIGRALANRLLARGHQVWGLARSDQAAWAAGHAGACRVAQCDVAQWEKISVAAREILSAWPAIDGLVTCAGLQGAIGPASGVDPREWSATLRVNLEGTYFALRAFHPGLVRAPRRAKIVCLSGGGASKARPNFSAYAAAKTGIVRLVETVAEEERGSRLDINALAPGAVHTRMTDAVLAAGAEIAGAEEYQAAQRTKAAGGEGLGRALDLAEWLLSPASDGISGRLLSAVWDPWPGLAGQGPRLREEETYTLRRRIPGKPA